MQNSSRKMAVSSKRFGSWEKILISVTGMNLSLQTQILRWIFNFILFLYELCKVYFHWKSLLSHHNGRNLNSISVYLFLLCHFFFFEGARSWISESHFLKTGHSLNWVEKADDSYSPVCACRFRFRYARILNSLFSVLNASFT